MPAAPLALAVAVLAALAQSSCGGRSDGESPITSPAEATPAVTQPAPVRILSVQQSEFEAPAELVIRDRAAWESAWGRVNRAVTIDGPAAAPAVDFGASTVVLVALGQRGTGGYEVRVDDVVRGGGRTVVRYTVSEPGAGCMTTQALTAPVDVVRVPRIDGTVAFERRTVRSTC